MNFEFHPEGFIQQLPKMGIGMLGVFMIVGVIIVVLICIFLMSYDSEHLLMCFKYAYLTKDWDSESIYS